MRNCWTIKWKSLFCLTEAVRKFIEKDTKTWRKKVFLCRLKISHRSRLKLLGIKIGLKNCQKLKIFIFLRITMRRKWLNLDKFWLKKKTIWKLKNMSCLKDLSLMRVQKIQIIKIEKIILLYLQTGSLTDIFTSERKKQQKL